MEISIDTSVMRQIALLAIDVSEKITSASASANAITQHNDWNCRERDFISDSVAELKKMNNGICESAECFSKNINDLADKYDELDISLLRLFDSFDLSVGSAMAIRCDEVDARPSVLTAYVQDKLGAITGLQEKELANLGNPISVCNFTEIQSAFEGVN